MSRCLICDVPASGLHFGVSCCRACAAFFRRTNQLKLKYRCRFEGNCNVTQNNRYSCRHCRFNKCVRNGMGSGGSHGDVPSASNCSTTPDLRHLNHLECDPSKSDSPGTSTESPPDAIRQPSNEATSSEKDVHLNIEVYLKSRLNFLFNQPTKLNYFPYSIPLSLCQQAMVAYANHTAMWPNCTKDKVREQAVMDMNLFMKGHYLEVEHVAQFCMSIQPFVQLPCDQKWLVFKHFWPRFIEMDRTYVTCKILGTETEDDRMVCFDGTILNFSCHVSRLEDISDYDETEIRRIMQGTQDVFKSLFTIPFKKYNPDEFELMYMVMSMMWNIRDVEGASEDTRNLSDNVRSRLSEDLYNYYTFELNRPNYAERIYKLSHLVTALDRIHERRQEDSHLSRTFNIFKYDVFLDSLK